MSLAEVGATPTSAFGFSKLSKTSPKNKSYFYILESESSQESDDGSETALSIQGKETDLAKDTSDTEWSTDENATDVEFEIASSEEDKADDIHSQVIDGEVTSEASEEMFETTTVLSISVLPDGDIVLADSEELLNGTGTSSESESEPYTGGTFKQCAQCRSTNNNPLYRYCEKCYKCRRDFFPPPPKRKRKSKRQKKVDSSLLYAINGVTVNKTPNLNFGSIKVPPSAMRNQSDSISGTNNTFVSPGSQTNEGLRMSRKRKFDDADDDLISKRSSYVAISDNGSVHDNILISERFDPKQSFASVEFSNIPDSLSFSQPVFSTSEPVPLMKSLSDSGPAFDKHAFESPVISLSDSERTIEEKNLMTKYDRKKSANGLDSDMCIICVAEPKSGIFVHGKIAHICCCYKCSVKVWMKTKRCPICKCKVNNVLRAVVM